MSFIECAICLQNCFSTTGKFVDCGHEFCKPCIDKWLQQSNKCPVDTSVKTEIFYFEQPYGNLIRHKSIANPSFGNFLNQSLFSFTTNIFNSANIILPNIPSSFGATRLHFPNVSNNQFLNNQSNSRSPLVFEPSNLNRSSNKRKIELNNQACKTIKRKSINQDPLGVITNISLTNQNSELAVQNNFRSLDYPTGKASKEKSTNQINHPGDIKAKISSPNQNPTTVVPSNLHLINNENLISKLNKRNNHKIKEIEETKPNVNLPAYHFRLRSKGKPTEYQNEIDMNKVCSKKKLGSVTSDKKNKEISSLTGLNDSSNSLKTQNKYSEKTKKPPVKQIEVIKVKKDSKIENRENILETIIESRVSCRKNCENDVSEEE